MYFLYVICIVIEIIMIFVCRNIAEEKGYDAIVGGLIGFFLGIIGLIIMLLMPEKVYHNYTPPRYNFWVCKNCGTENDGMFCSKCAKAKGYQPPTQTSQANSSETWVCKYCGQINSISDNFCKSCKQHK